MKVGQKRNKASDKLGKGSQVLNGNQVPADDISLKASNKTLKTSVFLGMGGKGKGNHNHYTRSQAPGHTVRMRERKEAKRKWKGEGQT